MNADQSKLAESFRHFGEVECRDSSPLYERLALEASKDLFVLELASHAQEGQPTPNMFFGAVHYLLLKGEEHDLAWFYKSLTTNPDMTSDPYPDFRAFCAEHVKQIMAILRTRRVQTNVVERCGLLYPAFSIVSKENDCAPMSMIEIGTSAGLNLLWDKYSYDYGDGNVYGDASSPVRIQTQLVGNEKPRLPSEVPEIVSRIGLEYSPIDLSNEDDALWLNALVWPENTTRLHNLKEAVKLFRADPPQVIKGNATDTLFRVITELPMDSTICIYHTHTLNQFSKNDKTDFYTILQGESERRDLYVVSSESRGEKYPSLEIDRYTDGNWSSQKLACSDPHGKWMKWLQA